MLHLLATFYPCWHYVLNCAGLPIRLQLCLAYIVRIRLDGMPSLVRPMDSKTTQCFFSEARINLVKQVRVCVPHASDDALCAHFNCYNYAGGGGSTSNRQGPDLRDGHWQQRVQLPFATQ